MFNFIEDASCPSDTAIIMSKAQASAYHSIVYSGYSDERLRECVDSLIAVASEQYWLNFDNSASPAAAAISELKRRGLWTVTDALKSRLEGIRCPV